MFFLSQQTRGNDIEPQSNKKFEWKYYEWKKCLFYAEADLIVFESNASTRNYAIKYVPNNNEEKKIVSQKLSEI